MTSESLWRQMASTVLPAVTSLTTVEEVTIALQAISSDVTS